MEAAADMMKAATDSPEEESNDAKPDLNLKEDDPALDPGLGKRKSKQIERGTEYKRDLLKKQYRSRKASVLNHLHGL